MEQPDLQPILVGKNITVRPLQNDDFLELYSAASDPVIWEQHPDSSRYIRDVFQARFFTGAINSGGAFAVVEIGTGRIIGSSRFYDWNSDRRELAIGYTFLERKHWGTGTNQEMKRLMLDHAFIQAQAVWFHVGKNNLRSRKAVEKLGARLSHETERELDGIPFVQLYYKLEASQYKT